MGQLEAAAVAAADGGGLLEDHAGKSEEMQKFIYVVDIEGRLYSHAKVSAAWLRITATLMPCPPQR